MTASRPPSLPVEQLLPTGIGDRPEGFSSLLAATGYGPVVELPPGATVQAPEATTILAAQFADGVIVVGDRQATAGYSIAHRRIQKVFAADEFSAVAISGTAGLAIEMVRLFQTELEHYEKLEGLRLSLDGKANFLARLVRQQLPMAFQGLVVIPLFAGYDDVAEQGRLFTFDVVGGTYEEHQFGATGSGSQEALSYLRSHFEQGLDFAGVLGLTLASLVAAAEQDVATGGPDLRRGILPSVVAVTAEGFQEIDAETIETAAEFALDQIR